LYWWGFVLMRVCIDEGLYWWGFVLMRVCIDEGLMSLWFCIEYVRRLVITSWSYIYNALRIECHGRVLRVGVCWFGSVSNKVTIRQRGFSLRTTKHTLISKFKACFAQMLAGYSVYEKTMRGGDSLAGSWPEAAARLRRRWGAWNTSESWFW
jgi:hypothetical protein